jgi:hypothetical protein
MRFLRVALFAAVAASVALAGVQAKDAAAEVSKIKNVIKLSPIPTAADVNPTTLETTRFLAESLTLYFFSLVIRLNY